MRAVLTILICSLWASSGVAEITVETRKDDFTGESNSVVFVSPSEGEMLLAISCSVGIAVILSHKYLAGNADDKVAVELKFDDELPKDRQYANLSRNNRMTIFGINESIDLVYTAVSSERLGVRIVDPSDNETLTSYYSLLDLEKSISKLECYR